MAPEAAAAFARTVRISGTASSAAELPGLPSPALSATSNWMIAPEGLTKRASARYSS